MLQAFLEEQLGIKEALPWEFTEGFLVNLALTWGFFVFSCVFSPLVWGDLPPEKKILWHTTFVAMCQPFYLGYMVWPDTVAVAKWWYDNPFGAWLDYPTTRGIYYGTGLSCGFMAMDSMAMAIWPKQLMHALRRSMFIQMWVHHIVSIIVWPYALVAHKCAVPIIYFVLTEVSNPCVNFRWILENRPGWAPSKMYYAIAGTMVVVFFLVRILPMPWFVFHMLRPSSYANATWFQTILFFSTGIIPFMLNAFWFRLMLRKVMRVLFQFFGKDTSKQSARKSAGGEDGADETRKTR